MFGGYDLLIKNGILFDPGSRMKQKSNLAIKDGKIAFIGKDASIKSNQVLDASGLFVAPGFIDLHIHAYWGVSHYGIEADPYCIAGGVTTAVDAGSAGAWTFPAFRRYIMGTSEIKLMAFLNISSAGMIAPEVGELEDIRYANVDKAIEVCERNKDVIVGVKVRLSSHIAGKNDMEALKRARKMADALGLPVMVHPANTNSKIDDLLAIMKEGDIMTHCYHNLAEGVLDENGKVKASVWEALSRGILLDVGHGQGSFSFGIATKAIDQGLLPYTISSDLHFYNTDGPVYDLATTVSKFLYMGLSLEKALEMCITNPAKFMSIYNHKGTLSIGADADITIFEIANGCFEFVDSTGEKRIGDKRLLVRYVIRGGKLIEVGDNKNLI